MLEEKDLQAIAQMIQGLEDRIDEKLEQQKKDILDEATHRMKVLLEAEVTPRFNLLAEGQEDILRRMPSEDDMDIIDGRLATLEANVRKLNREVEKLKKAQ